MMNRLSRIMRQLAVIPLVLLGFMYVSCTSDDTEKETGESMMLLLLDYHTVTSYLYSGSVDIATCEQGADEVFCTLMNQTEAEIDNTLPENSTLRVEGSGDSITVELDLTIGHLDGSRQRYRTTLSGKTEYTGTDTKRFTVDPTADLTAEDSEHMLMTIHQFDLDMKADEMNGVLRTTLHRSDNDDQASVEYSAYYTEKL